MSSMPGFLFWTWQWFLAPFESTDEVSEKFISFKVGFLLAIMFLKRVGDLQALSVAPSSLEFAPGRVKAILHPRQAECAI